MGLNSTRHAVTHRNKPGNAASKEQTFKSLYYQDSLREAIQVIIRKLDEKIESTNHSKIICADKPVTNLGLNNNQEGSVVGDSNIEQGAMTQKRPTGGERIIFSDMVAKQSKTPI